MVRLTDRLDMTIAVDYKPNTSPGVQWLSGRVLDLGPKGRGLEPHQCHCIVVL